MFTAPGPTARATGEVAARDRFDGAHDMVDLRASRTTTARAVPDGPRRDPQLHWLPLLAFGLLVLSQAPGLAASGGRGGTSWLLVLLCGTVASGAWFAWLRSAVHVTAPWRAAAAVWVLGAAVVWLLGEPALAEVLPRALGDDVQGDGGLVLVAAGFAALAYEQRSRPLAAASAVLLLVASTCALSGGALPALGSGGAAVVMATALLVPAALAWRASRRCRV